MTPELAPLLRSTTRRLELYSIKKLSKFGLQDQQVSPERMMLCVDLISKDIYTDLLLVPNFLGVNDLIDSQKGLASSDLGGLSTLYDANGRILSLE
ncbi:hypothetical protein TNCV_2080931 [Trichonephila clavipes]|nr:hypothetical protein TNCV_2080931 [Trichonephila clavipes]